MSNQKTPEYQPWVEISNIWRCDKSLIKGVVTPKIEIG